MSPQDVSRPFSVDEAVHQMGQHRDAGRQADFVAGATWLMRRRDRRCGALVSVTGIPSLREVRVEPDVMLVGAAVTHAELARGCTAPRLQGLAHAAATSANPSVRNMATVGGNLGAVGFEAADLVPALLAVGADVSHAAAEPGRAALAVPIAQWQPASGLLISVSIPAWFTRSTHRRLTLRAAGDYPVAIVSIAVDLDAGGSVRQVQVAVGALSDRAFRWAALEDALRDQPLHPHRAAAMATELSADLPVRDSIGVPGWYRKMVLTPLVRDAITDLASQHDDATPTRSGAAQ